MVIFMLCWVVSLYLLKVVVVAVFVVVVVVVVAVACILVRRDGANLPKARQCNPVRSCRSPKGGKTKSVFVQ